MARIPFATHLPCDLELPVCKMAQLRDDLEGPFQPVALWCGAAIRIRSLTQELLFPRTRAVRRGESAGAHQPGRQVTLLEGGGH